MPSRVTRSGLRAMVIRADRALRREFASTMLEVGQDLKAKHLQVVRDWQHDPRFVIGYHESPYQILVQLYPDGRNAKIWGYVDQGTAAHRIYPRIPGGKLKFQTGYSARTAPIAKYNQGTGEATGGWVTKEYVDHPGTDARLFSKTIAEDYRPIFYRKIEAAANRALRG